MALQTAYKRYLAAPSASALAEDASLHYIPTVTSFHGAANIIKHLSTQQNKLKKKKEDFLYAVEGQNTLAVEAETTFEFVSSGGAYLPGLDDNFLADRVVYLPIIHMVTFDDDAKIKQVRQSWDQGSLLKQLDVIGKTGRNWPIQDGAAQIKLITTCIKAGGNASATRSAELPARSRGDSTNVTRDPHASLALFAPRDDESQAPPPVISPYAGRRPPQRSFAEMLGDDALEEPASPTSPSKGRERSHAPGNVAAPKADVAAKLPRNRLFETDNDNDDTAAEAYSKKHQATMMRPDPKKYSHFDFADGSEAQDTAKPGQDGAQKAKGKGNNWSFDDFVAPPQVTATRTLNIKAGNVRHWGNENDVVEPTPVKRVQQIKPRRDAEPHFDFVDTDPAGEADQVGEPRGAAHNSGYGLYDNNLYNEDGSNPTPGGPPLGNITNVKVRRKDFDAQFHMTDSSPTSGKAEDPAKLSDDRVKAVRMLESNWSAYDESPTSQKENSNPNDPNKAKKAGAADRGIVIAGDGMGGKKRPGGGRGWGIGDESDDEDNRKPVPERKQHDLSKRSDFWDY
ncbi:hypothetical protein B0T19DRAFT_40067 [Cercophora scortea]|uniref:Uncharacterized protein n=1 Tax=Cercophora scortea TaxID=314031 RepID=A0AAE0J3X5_9PEZI|nr:hypothetical protein B0T19DRAFT_40067 [Cercophora scortea]